MLKKVGIALGVLAWIAGTLGFYLQLRTSGLLEWVQAAIIVGWIATGFIVISFLAGRELGSKNLPSKSIDDELEISHEEERHLSELENMLSAKYSAKHTRFTVVPDSDLPGYSICEQAAAIILDELKWLLERHGERSEIVVGIVGGATLRDIVRLLRTKLHDINELDCRRLRFVSLNMAGNSKFYQFSGNYLAVSLSEIFYGSTHFVVLPNWNKKQLENYNESVKKMDLVICSAGAKDGFLSEWLQKRNPPIMLPSDAVGDFCLWPIDARGNVVQMEPELKNAIEELFPRPIFSNLRDLQDKFESVIFPITGQPRQFTSNELFSRQFTEKEEITKTVLSSGIVSHCLFNKSLAENILW
jgi:hypothetical protein